MNGCIDQRVIGMTDGRIEEASLHTTRLRSDGKKEEGGYRGSVLPQYWRPA